MVMPVQYLLLQFPKVLPINSRVPITVLYRTTTSLHTSTLGHHRFGARRTLGWHREGATEHGQFMASKFTTEAKIYKFDIQLNIWLQVW